MHLIKVDKKFVARFLEAGKGRKILQKTKQYKCLSSPLIKTHFQKGTAVKSDPDLLYFIIPLLYLKKKKILRKMDFCFSRGLRDLCWF